MPHELITTLAAGFTAAWVFALIARRFGLSPIVGYLLAGILIGPHTPGIVADVGIANQFAEIGVILLMFGVGLHFHWKELVAVKGVAVPGAIGQSLAATLLAMLAFAAFGISLTAGAVLGMAMSVASTVVLLRVLADANQVDTPQGHIALGWLLVEDVLTVVLLVLIPVLAGADASAQAAETGSAWLAIGFALLKLAALVGLVMLAGLRAIPWILVHVAKLRSRELFTLTVLVFSIAIATASALFFGASMALGAFLAGMVVAQSPVSHQAAADALPLRDAFAVLFFVSVGMMFDPAFLIEHPLMALVGLLIVVVGKPLVALAIVAALGHPVRTALTVAVALAQIGEFSFILSDLASRHGLLPHAGPDLLVACAILSIAVNPVLFRSVPAIERWLEARPRVWRLLHRRAEKRLAAHVAAAPRPAAVPGAIVVGYGPVGRSVERLLRDGGLATTVIDLNMDTVSGLIASGRHAVFGDASREAVLEKAGIETAKYLVVTLPITAERAAVVAAARALGPHLRILVRAHYLSERGELEQAGATASVFEEAEAAVALARLVLADTGASREALDDQVRSLRMRLMLDNLEQLGLRPVSGVMVPWRQVRVLHTSDSLEDVLRAMARTHHSRWPVVERAGTVPIGYLLTKDLVTQQKRDVDWQALVRPMRSVAPDVDTETVLHWLQQENSTMAVVTRDGLPLGIVTIEDIVEQVVGRLEDEYPRTAPVTLVAAIAAGGIVLELEGRGPEAAIEELARSIGGELRARAGEIAALAIEREREVSTDLGCGVAVPHARCADLRAPVVVFGRSKDGIPFGSAENPPVRLVFLLVTPKAEPELQVVLLGRVAAVVSDPAQRELLLAARSAPEVLELVAALK